VGKRPSTPLSFLTGISAHNAAGRERMRATFYHAYFLPWLGYFAKIEVSDIFVVLDLAKFRRNHIKRVRVIGTQGEPEWLTLPVGNNWSVPCNEVTLPAEPEYLDKVLRTLTLSYRRAAEFGNEFARFERIFRSCYAPTHGIVEANITAITAIRSLWSNAPIQFELASDYSHSQNRDERMIEVCRALGITEIVAGDGSMLEVHDVTRIKRAGIKLLHYPYFKYYPIYSQMQRERSGERFIPGLSIVDAFFNVGAARVPELLQPIHLNLEPV
jgi:hypothetical protein